MKANILGTEYEIITRKSSEDAALNSGLGGYCDYTSHKIVVADTTPDPMNPRELENMEVVRRRLLRHELLHAFAHESGLGNESAWAQDEVCIDYFAKQMEKMIAVFMQTRALSVETINMLVFGKPSLGAVETVAGEPCEPGQGVRACT